MHGRDEVVWEGGFMGGEIGCMGEMKHGRERRGRVGAWKGGGMGRKGRDRKGVYLPLKPFCNDRFPSQ